MYSYLIEGSTVGQLLTRRLLRTLFGLPGMLIDLLVALFWVPSYRNYWEDAGIYYADNTRVGFVRGLTGWIGEVLGFVIGAPLGLMIGFSVFIADSILLACRFIVQTIFNYCEEFACFVGNIKALDNLFISKHPENYVEKAWNIGATVIGISLAAVPYTIIRGLEFFLPFLGNFSSKIVTHIAGFIGGVIGAIIAFPIFPCKYLLEKTIALYDLIRDKTQDAVAFVYAKTGERPVIHTEVDDCLPDAALHSTEFRNKVTAFGRSSWTELLFGPLNNAPVNNAPVPIVPVQTRTNERFIDPITLEPLGINGKKVLVDKYGHSYNDYGNTSGIRLWLNNHQTSPYDNRPLTSRDLSPNVAVNDFLSMPK